MALFGAFAQIIRQVAGNAAGNVALCILDLPSGAAILAGADLPDSLKISLIAALSGFGGVCIGVQNLRMLRDCGVRPWEFYALRLLAGILSGLMMFAQCRLACCAAPAILPAPFRIAALTAAILAVPAIINLRKSVS